MSGDVLTCLLGAEALARCGAQLVAGRALHFGTRHSTTDTRVRDDKLNLLAPRDSAHAAHTSLNRNTTNRVDHLSLRL